MSANRNASSPFAGWLVGVLIAVAGFGFLATMVLTAWSPELQDRDFHPLEHGAAIFLQLDGSTTGYDREPGLVPLFINEAAYYEKGVAFALAQRRTIRLDTLEQR